MSKESSPRTSRSNSESESSLDSSSSDKRGHCGECKVKLDYYRDGSIDDGFRCNNCYHESREGDSSMVITPDYRRANKNSRKKNTNSKSKGGKRVRMSRKRKSRRIRSRRRTRRRGGSLKSSFGKNVVKPIRKMIQPGRYSQRPPDHRTDNPEAVYNPNLKPPGSLISSGGKRRRKKGTEKRALRKGGDRLCGNGRVMHNGKCESEKALKMKALRAAIPA